MEQIKTYRACTLEKVEITTKRFIGKKVEIKTFNIEYELNIDNNLIDYSYLISGLDEPERFMIRPRNIKEIYYNNEENTFEVFFDYEFDDYMLTFGKWFSVDEITKQDLLDECASIENIFSIDLFEYFKGLGIKVNTNQEELKLKIIKQEEELKQQYKTYAKYTEKMTRRVISKEIIKM